MVLLTMLGGCSGEGGSSAMSNADFDHERDRLDDVARTVTKAFVDELHATPGKTLGRVDQCGLQGQGKVQYVITGDLRHARDASVSDERVISVLENAGIPAEANPHGKGVVSVKKADGETPLVSVDPPVTLPGEGSYQQFSVYSDCLAVEDADDPSFREKRTIS